LKNSAKSKLFCDTKKNNAMPALRLTSVLIITLLLSSPSLLIGQDYSSSSKKAVKLFKEALSDYQLYNYESAEDKAKQALDKDSDFTEAYLLLSDIYEASKQYNKQSEILKTAVQKKPDKKNMILLKLIETELKIGHYQSAHNYISNLEKEKLPDFYRENLNTFKKAAIYALNAMKNPVDFKPVNCGSIINSANDDYFPAITADGKSFYKTVNLPTGRFDAFGNEFFQEDLFITRRKADGTPIETEALPEEVNTPGNEGAFSVSQDGKSIFFTVCSRSRGISHHGEVVGSCDIFIAEIQGDKITISNPGRPLNSAEWDSQPSFSSDGKTLYFVSGRKGGLGKSDIWVTEKNKNGKWSEPKNLGAEINTEGNERTPFIHADGKTLYFSSDGHAGMGNLDIYLSRKDEKGNWSKPKNLGYPINTHTDEMGLIVSAVGDSAFFSAERKNTRGGLDIYRFALQKENKPEKTAFIAGRIYDTQNKQSLQAEINLINTETGKLRATNQSDSKGEYLICINAGNNFAFHVNKTGYMFYSDSFRLKETNKIGDKYIKNIPLTPIEKGKRVVLKNVFFDTDSFKLRPESYPELDNLYEFLINNPTTNIEISGHTDNTGSAEYNKSLSTKRAKAVYTYLRQKGIREDRMQYKGYGSERPVAKNNTPENRQKNRRTEFSITKN
jgi:outer membrane protein OmpA-like peptidoglycan-associated protein